MAESTPRPASHLTGARVVITGAAGFIGSALARRLVESHGCEVVAIDNERSGDWSRLDVPIERIDQSIEALSADEWADLCTDADYLFHLAAEKYNSPGSTPERIIDTNVTAFHRLLQGCARAELGKVVFTSSLYAYGSMGPDQMRESDVPKPTTMYGASKVMGENLLRIANRDHGLRWSTARLFFIYGPRQYAEGGYKSVILSNFERILDGQAPTINGDGRQALDYVYIDDCIEALVALAGAETDGMTLNVGSGTAVSIEQLTARMLALASSELAPIYSPPDWTAGSIRCADASSIQEIIEWSSTTDLDAGLEAVFSWMSDHGGAP